MYSDLLVVNHDGACLDVKSGIINEVRNEFEMRMRWMG